MPINDKNKRSIGSSFEDKAVSFLEKKGCRVIDRNYRCRAGEIDIIYYDTDDTVCFGEVKYRTADFQGYPEEAVDFRKQRKICLASDFFRAANGMDESLSFRYDVIAITPDDIRWIKNAFFYTGV